MLSLVLGEEDFLDLKRIIPTFTAKSKIPAIYDVGVLTSTDIRYIPRGDGMESWKAVHGISLGRDSVTCWALGILRIANKQSP